MAHVQGRRRSPEAHSNLCSRLFFTWASPLFALANRKVRVRPVLSGFVFRVFILRRGFTRCHRTSTANPLPKTPQQSMSMLDPRALETRFVSTLHASG